MIVGAQGVAVTIGLYQSPWQEGIKGVESGVNTGNKITDLSQYFAGCLSPAFALASLGRFLIRKSFAVSAMPPT